jgi:HSP20 family protein
MYELRRMREAMDRRWRGPAFATGSTERKEWAIPVDVVEEAEEILVQASVPGVKPEDIDVSIEDSVLAIRAKSAESKVETERKEGGYLIRERCNGLFHRSLRLPDTVDTDKAKTHYENGILTVTLPKAESKKARHLKVTAWTASAGEAG